MITAIEPTEATATPFANPQARLEQMLQAIAKGATIDNTEVRNVCFDVSISRKKFDRLLRDAIRRHKLPKEREQRQQQFDRLAELEAGGVTTRRECEGKVAELTRGIEKAIQEARAPIAEYDRKHGEELDSLRHLQSGDREWNDEYNKFMVRSADRKIGFKIAELNTELLALQPELESCYAALNEKKNFHEEIEWTGMGPRLVSRTPINRNWWQARFDEAASVYNDPEAPPAEKLKYERMFHLAAARLDAIDKANKRIQEIHAQQAAIRQEIERVQSLFFVPEFLHVDLNEADA